MSTTPSTDIAIIGMAGRFPGAQNVDQLWRNVRDGVESVTRLSEQELIAAGVAPELLTHPDYVRSAIVLENFDEFDAAFFGLSPKDAAIMDPQHRVFLECCWEAFEHAGYRPDRLGGTAGVFAGCGMNAYFMFNLLTNQKLMDSTGLFLVRHTGNDKDFLATRVSYSLNLKGPSVNVQTACSTSLVAIHMASQTLLNGECDFALAGGVTIEIPHRQGYLYHDSEILAKDGHCRAFDAASTGTIFGSGAGVVVLRRLDEAIEAGDTIHAVIKGSAINNDGSGKVGYLAPSVDGQAAAIAEALGVAGVSPETISYIATHGTGTPVGDPIEIAALTQAFRQSTEKRDFCAVTSLKANIGHLDTAAGVASLVQTVQALKHKQIPPSLHFEKPNALIDFASTPFYVNAQLKDWPRNGSPRRAGVSSLGVGGTNAHVVLEEAPEPSPCGPGKPCQILTISGHSKSALDSNTERLKSYFLDNPKASLADVAYTLHLGRKDFKNRRILVCSDSAEAVSTIESRNPRRVADQTAAPTPPKVAFLFAGGGAQHPNMGVELYRDEPIFRDAIDNCLQLLRGSMSNDLREVMYPQPDQLEEAARLLQNPSLGLPALFTIQYALAQLWMSWGVRPAAMIGHSVGAHAEGCIAGITSLEDALRIVVLRGRLFDSLPEGGMLSVTLSEEELRPLLSSELSIAAINSPDVCTVSGNVQALVELERSLGSRDVECRRLHISVGAHSPMVEPILGAFSEELHRVRLHAPTVPCVSALTGEWMTSEQAQDPAFWVKKLRNTVRFSDALEHLLRDPNYFLLEVGPGQSLTSIARQHPSRRDSQAAHASLPRANDAGSDRQHLLTTLGRLWLSGYEIDWAQFHSGDRRNRIPLPTYAFDHQRYWIEGGKPSYQEETKPAAAPATAKRRDDIASWFAQPAWTPAPLTALTPTPRMSWLIFEDSEGIGAECAQRLKESGHTVFRVIAGGQFTDLGSGSFMLRPGEKSDYEQLLRALPSQGTIDRVLHLWSVIGNTESRNCTLESVLDRSFHSLLFFMQALAASGVARPVDVSVVSNNLHKIGAERPFLPERAVLLGPVRVVPAELPEISCRSIDIEQPREGRTREAIVVEVLAEAVALSEAAVVCYRNGTRYVQKFEPSLPAASAKPRLRDNATYLITGGLGGIALSVAGVLAERRSTLILVGRSAFPDRSEWDRWIEVHGSDNQVSTQIAALRRLEEQGARAVIAQADVTDRAQLETVLNDVRNRFGPIHGVVHAAGVLQDGIFQAKELSTAERVLAPKVRGTLLLDALLAKEPLDFFVVFSSVSSLIAPAGQIDYVAANSFLDAFAQTRASEGRPYVSINWAVWREIGMAVRAAQGTGVASPSPALAGAPVSHPLLDVCTLESENQQEYRAKYDRSAWVFAEHTLNNGAAVLPGTAYIELIRGGAPKPCEIRNLLFLSPLQIEAGSGPCEVRVQFSLRGTERLFTLSSRPSPDADWREHATAEIVDVNATTPGVRDLEQLFGRIQPEPTDRAAGYQSKFVRFGPRWQCLRSVGFAEDEAVGILELPIEFAGDLNRYGTHPALLDIATGFALPLLKDYTADNLFVPLSYGRIRVLADLPSKIVSHVRRCSGTSHNVGAFDITITDLQGNVVFEAEEFSVKAVTDSLQSRTPGEAETRTKPPIKPSTALRVMDWIANGIGPQEGAEAFRRVLHSDLPAQIVISPVELAALQEQVRPSNARVSSTAETSKPEAGDQSIEGFLSTTMQDLLGVEHVGLDDDFFDLGGHSLIAIRLFTRIKKAFDVDFGLATLFQARTVRQLATLLQKPEQRASFSSLVPVQSAGSLPPLFMIHGAGGNVVGFDALVRHLGTDQPVYALQSQGLDGIRPHLTTIEEMAAHYIDEIRTVQPRGPYCLLGYSFGGVVAFEMAHQLLAAGEDIRMLGMLDTFQVSSVGYGGKFRYHLHTLMFGPNRVHYAADRIGHLLRRFLPEGKQLPEGAPLKHFDTIRMANELAGQQYDPIPYPGTITLFRAAIRPSYELYDYKLGWSALAEGVDVIEVPGNHFSMGEDPNAAILSAKIAERLRCADRLVLPPLGTGTDAPIEQGAGSLKA